jgi:CHAD domain-containing protein
MTPPLRTLVAHALRDRLAELANRPETDRAGTDELVHDLRVAVKEFRAYLDLLQPAAGDDFCAREHRRLQAVARNLAEDRDPLVIRQTIERLAQKHAKITSRHSLHRMLLHLGEERVRSRAQPPPVQRAIGVLAKTAGGIRRRLHARLSDTVLLDAFRQEYRQARKLTRKHRDAPDMKNWHRWRKQVKALHYQAACLSPIRPGKLTRLARQTWKLQALLGKHHDLHLTRTRLRRLRIDPINEPCRKRTLHLIDAELKRIEKKAGRTTRSLFKRPAREFAASLTRAKEA